MTNRRIKASRTIYLTAMFALWALAQSLCTGALTALDQGNYFTLATSVVFGGGALYLSWCCWVRWCWKSQVRPMAHYVVGRG